MLAVTILPGVCETATTEFVIKSGPALLFWPVENAAHGTPSDSADLEAIAGSPHRADRIGAPSAHQRLAQPADVHVDGALVHVDVVAPHAVEQLAAREHAARRLHEELEQAVIGGAQVDRLPPAQYRHGGAVEL